VFDARPKHKPDDATAYNQADHKNDQLNGVHHIDLLMLPVSLV
jgi:hypothetical protein